MKHYASLLILVMVILTSSKIWVSLAALIDVVQLSLALVLLSVKRPGFKLAMNITECLITAQEVPSCFLKSLY